MAVTESYRSFILEQLEQVAPAIAWRSMFGGVGIYAGEHFFALIANDVLYFKVDDETRPTYTARNMEPFRPYGEDGETMGYYEVPLSVVEDTDALRDWVADAVAVSRRARQNSRRRSKR